jgi:hypothetical protein
VLKEGGESARNVLLNYLTVRQESVMTGQKIVEALIDFPAQESVTMESVCKKIKAGIEDIPLPEEDKKPTKGERVEKWLMRIAAVVLFAAFGLLGIGVLITYREEFPFHRFYTGPVYYIGTLYVLSPILLSAFILFLYRKGVFIPKRRRWLARIALGIACLTAVQPFGMSCLGLVPPIYSETNDPENYLTFGTYVNMYRDSIYKLFPANIPRCAIAEDSEWYPPDKFLDTTKYYYYFQDVVDPSFNIYAEWVLPENEFAEELNRVRNYYPDGANQQVQWGNWVCMSFTDDTLDFDEAKDKIDYYYLLFAYNEKTGGVRYIASYSMDCGREEDPYFLSLQWE